MSEETKYEAVTEETSGISKSKAKREARAKEVRAEKAKKNFDQILGWIVGIIIAVAVIGVIGMGIYTSASKTNPSSDYSGYITAEGYVEGADLSSVKNLELESLVIPYAEIFYMDDKVESDIYETLNTYSYYNSDASDVVANGDTIYLDYSGSIDGVKFDGGTAENQSLTIGSGQFIPGFEDQLVGAHPGDSVDVVVTFPDPYEKNPDLAGKEALFECTVNSILRTPELTDEFVATYCSDVASTVDELRAHIKNYNEKENIKTYIATYVNDNASVSKFPSAYVKHMREIQKYYDQQSYEYMNELYSYYYGYSVFDSFEAYTGMTDSEYEKYLRTIAKSQTAADMTYEEFFKRNNLSISDELYAQVVESFGGEDAITEYGEPYVRQTAIKTAVVEYLLDKVTVKKDTE